MEKPLPGQRDYLDASIKTSQYLAGLTTQQDIWSETGKVLVSFFGADMGAFGEAGEDGLIAVHHWTFSDKFSGVRELGAETREAIAEVLENGFLTLRIIFTPDPLSVACLPITLENKVVAVMLVGHRASKPLPKELLNVYLAVAGLVGTTAARLASERELRKHRSHLEQLVRKRTAELTKVNEELRGEISARIKAEIRLRERTTELSQANKALEAEISERKRAEEILKKSEERYNQFFKTSGDCVFITSNDGSWIDMNDAAVELFGYSSPEELMQVNVRNIYANPEERAKHTSIIAECGFTKEFPAGLLRKDGTVRHCLITSVPRYDAEGNVAGFQGTIRDITERKRAEKLTAIRMILLEFAASHSLDELLVKTLDEIGILTDSPIGFYHFVESDGKTLSLQAWSTRTRKEFCTAAGQGLHYGIDQAGVWVDCIHERKPVIHNDYPALPHRKGMPEGHAPVIRELVVPIMRSDRIVAILGIGNKHTDYNDGDIEVVSYLADVAWDITERKRAEQTLRESEKKSRAYLRSLIENAPDIIVTLDVDGFIDYESPSVERVLGYKPTELNAGNPFELVHPDDRPTVMDAFDDIIRNPGVSVHKELRFLDKSGSWRDLEVVAQNLLENEAVKRIVVNAHDITTRKIIQDALIIEKDQLKTLLSFYRRPNTDINDITVFVIEECVRISQSSLAFFGFINGDETLMRANMWSEEAMKGCEIDFKPLEFQLDHAGIWAEAIRMHESLIVNDYLSPDPRKKGYPKGHVPIQRLMSIPIIKEAKAVAILAVANKKSDYNETDLLHLSLFLESAWDMIMRKRAEEEKEKIEVQNRQLQKAESLGRMAGAIAHHFNNQLGAVMGNLELAMMHLPEGAQPRKNLAAAMEASHRAAEVSDLMLTYLGQKSGKKELLDLSDACRMSLPLLRAAMPEHIALEADLPLSGLWISADADQIHQVLTNLVTNAWEAVGCAMGVVHLRVKKVFSADIPATRHFPIDWQPQDNAYACIEVADEGCGIADKDIEKLFDPFFSSKFTGRGLGLPVVLGVLRAHGGAITVESEPGRRSLFRLFLPLSAEYVQGSRGKPVEAREIEGGGTVLLAEDDETLRSMTEAMLMRLGCAVLGARDGVEAVEVFRQHQYEIRCVLCDLTMPR
jgi:PAS domain S-box-containing protein